jgi:hypothetical protein
MPPTPYIVSRTPTIHTETHSTIARHETTSDAAGGASSLAVVSQNVIRLMPEVISQTMKSAKILVTRVIFSKNAMVCSKKKKRRIIDDVI